MGVESDCLSFRTLCEKSQILFLRSIDKHKPIATRTALTLSVLRATYRCLCCRTELSSLRSVGMTFTEKFWLNCYIVA